MWSCPFLHEHPFLKSRFLVATEVEIQKISELGLKSIQVDPSRSRPVKTSPAAAPPGRLRAGTKGDNGKMRGRATLCS